jgi:hypothetical protein
MLFDVVFIYVWSESDGKLLFLLRKEIKFRQMEIADKVLAYHPLTILQKAFLPFPPV